MEFIIRIIFLIIGFFIGSIGLAQIFIIIMFSKKFTKKLNNYGLLTDVFLVKKKENSTLKIWLIIYPLITIIIYIFASFGSFIYFVIGSVIAIMIGFKFYGLTANNMNDYIKNHITLIEFNNIDNINDDEQFKEFMLAISDEII